MRQCLVVGGAIMLSLLVGWTSAYTASRIDLRLSQHSPSACQEAGHGDAPSWIDFLLIVWFVGPPLLFGTVAFVGSRKNWSIARWTVSFGLLLLLTACFYFAWYACRA